MYTLEHFPGRIHVRVLSEAPEVLCTVRTMSLCEEVHVVFTELFKLIEFLLEVS